jgi:hypothetical protein
VILDTKGNIFGGFTPVKWESRVHNKEYMEKDNRYKADHSQKSFLFTLKNPHNIPARRFALKAERWQYAIVCDSKLCACFGCGHDIAIVDNSNAITRSYTSYFGTAYINDSGLDGKTFFTGSGHFQVEEIEVFEITD